MKIVKLSDVIVLKKGKKPSILIEEKKEGYEPYILIEQMEGHPIRQYTNDNCPMSTKDDTLMVRDGAGIGKIATNIEGIIGSTISAITPIGINKDFLFWFLTYAKEIIRARPKGTGIPHVDPTIFNNLQIPVCPLSQQQAILNEIEKQCSRLDNGLQSLEKIKADLKSYKASVLKSAIEGKLTEDWRESRKETNNALDEFRNYIGEREKLIRTKTIKKVKQYHFLENKDPFEIPKNWAWIKFGDVGANTESSIVDGPFGSSINVNQDYINSGIQVIRMLNVKPGRLILDKLKYVSEEKFKTLKRHNILPGDILLSKVGAGIGEACLVPENFKEGMLATTGISRIRPGEIVLNKYVLYFIFSISGYLKNIASASAQPFLNMTTIKGIHFPLPPLVEQQKIVQEVEEKLSVIEAVSSTIEINIKKSKQLKQSILHQAFTGNLVPMQDDKEGVEKLLIEIEKMKNELAAQKKIKKVKQK